MAEGFSRLRMLLDMPCRRGLQFQRRPFRTWGSQAVSVLVPAQAVSQGACYPGKRTPLSRGRLPRETYGARRHTVCAGACQATRTQQGRPSSRQEVSKGSWLIGLSNGWTVPTTESRSLVARSKLNYGKGLQSTYVLPSLGMFGKLAKLNNDGTGARRLRAW
jgi:hypothetical protein